jgi:MscS family membrane protein
MRSLNRKPATRKLAMFCAVLGAGLVFAPPLSAQPKQPTLKEVLEEKKALKEDEAPEESAAPAEKAAPSAKPVLRAKPTAKKAVAPAAQAKPVPKKPEIPEDDYGRGTPRSAVKGYLAAAESGNFEHASKYLDLRHLPRGSHEKDGPQLARRLKIVLERTLWIDLDSLSDDPAGRADDGQPTYRDLAGHVTMPQGKVDILLQRVPRKDGVHIWKLSNATAAKIPQMYQHYGYGPAIEALSRALPSGQFLGFHAWQWGGLLALLGIAYLAMMIPTGIIARLIRRKALISVCNSPGS